MRSTQFDDRFPYEEELKNDWQRAATLDDACARKQFDKTHSGLIIVTPKLMNVRVKLWESCQFSAKRQIVNSTVGEEAR